ncbi:alpha/beta hydrolase [Bifidobacterium gallicum]|nr:alpha/beta fold hydrolase [Bifidobacterium gallicum]KFI58909.1 hydrolase of alpha-beta family protein [Bifidobacterium gallicum DSM 20093 = LMG 11596]
MAEQHFRVEDLDIEREGIKLHTRITRPASNGALDVRYPAVIMMHGLFGTLGYEPTDLFAELSDKLVAAGFMTVRFDFDGRGKSGGEPNGFDPYTEIEDAIAVLDYVRNLDDVEKISLLGHSFGGVVAGMTAGMYADVIHSLVLMAPAATSKSDAMHGHVLDGTFDPMHIPQTIDIPSHQAKMSGRFPRIIRIMPVYEVPARFDGPALCVQGNDDQVVSPHASKNYAEVMPNCTATFYNNLGHTFTGSDRELALDEITQFLVVERTAR